MYLVLGTGWCGMDDVREALEAQGVDFGTLDQRKAQKLLDAAFVRGELSATQWAAGVQRLASEVDALACAESANLAREYLVMFPEARVIWCVRSLPDTIMDAYASGLTDREAVATVWARFLALSQTLPAVPFLPVEYGATREDLVAMFAEAFDL